MRLLVVSHQQDLCDYLESVCRYFGYVTDFADDAREAAQLADSRSGYRVILYDATEARAIKHFEMLRQAASESDILIIVNDEFTDELMWRRRGAAGVLITPILPGHLKFEIIRRASAAA